MPSTTFVGSPGLVIGLAAIIISVLSGVFRAVVLERNDQLHCESLLNQGQWLDHEFTNWQPEGCMMHAYRPNDLTRCVSNEIWVFIGDSVTRKLFYHIAHAMDETLPHAAPNNTAKHVNYKLETKGGTELLFFWDPFLNSTQISDYASVSGSSSLSPTTTNASVLVIGSGLWYLRHGSSGGIAAWEARMEAVLDTITSPKFSNTTEVVVLPVEVVIPSKLSLDRAQTMRIEDIDAMNMDLSHRISVARGKSPKVYSPQAFNLMVHPSQTEDGLHFSSQIIQAQANVLFNHRCNELLPRKYPYDTTCCRPHPSRSMLYICTLSAIFLAGPIFWVLSHPADHALYLPPSSIAPLTISLGTALVYIADRSSFWLKEHKQFDSLTFGFLSIVALGVGLGTLKQSTKDLGFLNREQTDEWKGWMQMVILIYHYTGASKISGIYNPIRVLVASYLFMTGYGHTIYYIKKADFGFTRISQILIRLNLYTIILAYAMDTDYLFYYFSPLVSLWFVVLYATMALGSRYNDRTPFLVGKIVVSAAAIAWFMHETWLLEVLFTFLERIFAIHWSAKEWAFRVNLDILMVHVGMLVAVAFIKIKDQRIPDLVWWPTAVKASAITSAGVLVFYFYFELNQESKFTYNKWHPYIAFLPVLALAVLRNATPGLRSRSSRVFAFIGQCSLETFVIQYHLWLAGDTKGVLLVIPGTRWRPVNFIVTTTSFIFVSDRVAKAVNELTSRICSIPPKPATTLPLHNVVEPEPGTSQSQPKSIPQEDQEKAAPTADAAVAVEPGPQTQEASTRRGRWVDRLADGAESIPKTELKGRLGLKSKVAIGLAVMWILNVLW